MRQFSKNKVLDMINTELSKQLKLHLLPYSATLWLIFAVGDYDDTQTGLSVIIVNDVCEAQYHAIRKKA